MRQIAQKARSKSVDIIVPEPLPKLLIRFEQWLHDNDKADHNIRVYVSTVRQFAAWFEATNGYPLAPNVLTPTDLRQYREKLIADNSKPASTNRVIAALRALGDWIAESYDVANPAAKVKSVAMAGSMSRSRYRSRRNISCARHWTDAPHMPSAKGMRRPGSNVMRPLFCC